MLVARSTSRAAIDLSVPFIYQYQVKSSSKIGCISSELWTFFFFFLLHHFSSGGKNGINEFRMIDNSGVRIINANRKEIYPQL